MKPKHKPCINCGANEYEVKSLNTLACEYCGTEYEVEMPEEINTPDTRYFHPFPDNLSVAFPMTQATYLTGTFAVESLLPPTLYYKRRFEP